MRVTAKPFFLIVEHNEGERLLIEEAFEASGCAVNLAFAKDGQEAIKYLQWAYFRIHNRPALRPSLLLLDLDIPGKNAHEVIQELKAYPDLKDMPIIILTTSLDGEAIESLYRLGVTSFFTKPSTFTELLRVVTHIYYRAKGSTKTQNGPAGVLAQLMATS
jgi:CheY-like chemotaxis protein